MLVRTETFRFFIEGGTELEVLNGGSGGVWSTSGAPNNWVWTTTAETTLLVACLIIGATNNSESDFSALTFNGDAMTEIGKHGNGSEGFPRGAAPGQQWWFLQNPDVVTDGALTPTLAGWDQGTTTNNYAGIFMFNIKGANASDPIGASDFPAVLATTVAANKSDSITTTTNGAIILTVGSVQGGSGSTASFSAADSVTMLGSQVQTGSSTTIDGTFAGGWKAAPTAGATAYGWAWVNSDGHGISSVEILPE